MVKFWKNPNSKHSLTSRWQRPPPVSTSINSWCSTLSQVSPGGTHMGLIVYNKRAKTLSTLNDSAKQSPQAIKTELEPEERGWGTNTDRALEEAVNMFTPENGDRPDKPNVLIVITDGKNRGGDLAGPLDALKVRMTPRKHAFLPCGHPISYPDPWMSYAHARRSRRLWQNPSFRRSWLVISKKKAKRPEVTSFHDSGCWTKSRWIQGQFSWHRGNTYLTSLPLVSGNMYLLSLLLVSVRHHGRVNSVKVEMNFTSSASSIFLVHNSCCDKCI